jgi:5-methylcytosine-specific restriction endonuclease McrA
MNSRQKAAKIAQLRARDGDVCHLCRGHLDFRAAEDDPWMPTLDHVVPVSQGGTNALSNLRLAHRCCNSERGNTSLGKLTA